MPDPTKRIDRAEIARRVERAEKLLQKGKTSEALDEYLQVLAEDPQNDNVRQMAADICLSLQRTAEAVKLLGELFERQIAAGENTRASLTYKKLARYTVPTSIQRVHFGQILETSNRKLALETYESALDDFTKAGRKHDCLIVLEAPGNTRAGREKFPAPGRAVFRNWGQARCRRRISHAGGDDGSFRGRCRPVV